MRPELPPDRVPHVLLSRQEGTTRRHPDGDVGTPADGVKSGQVEKDTKVGSSRPFEAIRNSRYFYFKITFYSHKVIIKAHLHYDENATLSH